MKVLDRLLAALRPAPKPLRAALLEEPALPDDLTKLSLEQLNALGLQRLSHFRGDAFQVRSVWLHPASGAVVYGLVCPDREEPGVVFTDVALRRYRGHVLMVEALYLRQPPERPSLDNRLWVEADEEVRCAIWLEWWHWTRCH